MLGPLTPRVRGSHLRRQNDRRRIETNGSAGAAWVSKLIAGFLLFGFLLFVAAAGGLITTHKEVRRCFAMPDSVGVAPEHIRAAVLQQVPVGSSRSAVEQYLARRGIGTDGHSLCENSRTPDRISCRIRGDHHGWELLRESYLISFLFDSEENLQDVSVQKMTSGVFSDTR